MNFEPGRLSSAWGHIAFCANPTWAPEPPDDYTLSNQRLLTQHYRVSQLLQDTALDSQNLQTNNQCELSENKLAITSQSHDNGSNSCRRSVKDVIPESRLARFYGDFYYDDEREKCYTSPNERSDLRHNGQGSESADPTECWMLPEVEYWFHKMVDDPSDRSQFRRRQDLMLPDEDLKANEQSYLIPEGSQVHRRSLRKASCVKCLGDNKSIAKFSRSPDDAEVAALAARLRSVRYLWEPARPRPPSPPNVSRKMRARRQQPRRMALPPPPPAYCLDIPAQLLCHPTCKFQFDPPRPPQLAECHRVMGRLSARVHMMNSSASRCQPYRGTNVSRYAPTQRPVRNTISTAGQVVFTRAASQIPSTSTAFRMNSISLVGQLPSTNGATHLPSTSTAGQLLCNNTTSLLSSSSKNSQVPTASVAEEAPAIGDTDPIPPINATSQMPSTSVVDQLPSTNTASQLSSSGTSGHLLPSNATIQLPSSSAARQLPSTSVGGQLPSTSGPSLVPSSSSAGQMPPINVAAINAGLRKKRLYSTVLSMSAPAPIALTPVVRLAQKLVAPGLIKLNSKLVLSGARVRPPQVDHKFEELEKEALEQYKASDESIDTKFRELEKEAQEQYSNSNTSCSSGNSAEKQASTSPSMTDTKSCSSGNSVEKRTSTSPSETNGKNKQSEKFHKEKSVDSVVIYSQNFPDLNSKGHTSSDMNLKNFHTPPRGEKKEQTHRSSKNLRNFKSESQRAASDTDYEVRENSSKDNHKGARWPLPKKQRHLTLCVSDCSSDEEFEEGVSRKPAGPRIKNRATKMRMSAHGGGDLNPIMRKA